MVNKRNIIVYFGIIQYDFENAMCQRAKGINNLIESAGYIGKIIGVNSLIKRGDWKKRNEKIYEINYPKTSCDWLVTCLSSRDIKGVLLDIGLDNIKTFIMADYRFIPMVELYYFCKKNSITFVADIMDWFIANKSLNNKIKKIDNDFRMKFFYPKISNKIYICSAYENILGVGDNTAIIPSVTEENSEQFLQVIIDNDEKIKLFFAGIPGKRCEKEKINWVIKAIDNIELRGKFLLNIAGISKEEFVESNEQYAGYLNNDVIFLGRISHKQCINNLMHSDFSLIIRPNTKLSNFGFSTKMGEAFQCGIPVLATDTSDNKLYISNGENGFICDCSYEEVYNMLFKISKLSRGDLEQLKEKTRSNNPLNYKKFVKEFLKVI